MAAAQRRQALSLYAAVRGIRCGPVRDGGPAHALQRAGQGADPHEHSDCHGGNRSRQAVPHEHHPAGPGASACVAGRRRVQHRPHHATQEKLQAAARMSSRASLILFLILAGGCSATIIPPASPLNPRTIYIADYGRHSSILLPKPDGKFTEYAWGDWQWFALGDTSAPSAIRAVLFSDSSTLGQREVARHQSVRALKRALDADHMLRIECSADRIEILRDQLNE